MQLVAALRVAIKLPSHLDVLRTWLTLDFERIACLNWFDRDYEVLGHLAGVAMGETDLDVLDALYLVEVMLAHFQVIVVLFLVGVLSPQRRRWITASEGHFLGSVEEYLVQAQLTRPVGITPWAPVRALAKRDQSQARRLFLPMNTAQLIPYGNGFQCLLISQSQIAFAIIIFIKLFFYHTECISVVLHAWQMVL